MLPEYLVVLAATDPVAEAVSALWGVPEATGGSVDGAPIRRLSEAALVLRRPGPHIRDEHLDQRLPADLRERGLTLVFPSIHRSEQNVACLTVHPLGNLGDSAEVGGRPRSVTPTDARRMVDALRRLHDGRDRVGLSATFEATHHGPELGLPAFFVEIGFGTASGPPREAVQLLAEVVPGLVADPGDRVALAVGGGHYAPHFTDLAVKRHWAFGHIVSKHALASLDAGGARAAWDATPGAEGIVFARAEDAGHPAFEGVGPRLRDPEAPARPKPATSPSRSASGT
jgi:D-tyrosyl-tRNA(Tyr) deacylase